MSGIYGELWLRHFDIIERNDFYGITGRRCTDFLSEKMGLTENSRVLDLCCGIGGPARFLAKKYGCRVTGIDVSEYNCPVFKERTNRAGLEHLVSIVEGNVLEVEVAPESYTHVLGVDAWCYFPEKTQIYQKAYRSLAPGGMVAFLDCSDEVPSRYRFEKFVGRCFFESVPDHVRRLDFANFTDIRFFDITKLAQDDIMDAIRSTIKNRKALSEPYGLEMYLATLETFTDYLMFSTRGTGRHVAFTATKSGPSGGSAG